MSGMRRRNVIALLAGGMAAWPLAARAQQPAMPVIGYLAPASSGDSPHFAAAFRRGLNELGLVEGRNVAIEYRFADHRIEQLPALAADLARRGVAVIVAFSTGPALAAKAATTTIPIVFTTGDDPAAAGLVSRLNRPEGNLTGVTFISATLGAKQLELLRSLVPNTELIAVLVDPSSAESRARSQDVQDAARALGQRLIVLDAGSDTGIDAAFASLAERGARAFFVSGSPFTNARKQRILSQAARNGVAGMYTNRDYPEAGGLISYGTSIADAYRQVGIYAGRIVRGERPADLPVLLPTKFELVINLKTAKALGLDIPPMLLALADEVIE